MAFQPTINGALVVVPFVAAPYTWSNHLWFSKSDFDETDLVNLCDGVVAAYFQALDGYFNSTLTYGPAIGYDMREQDGFTATGSDDPEGGEGLDGMLGPAQCVVVTLRTAKRGRAYRGRTYLAGFGEASMDNGAWATGLTTACANWGSLMMSIPLLTGWTFGVRSGQLNGVVRESAVIEPVTSVQVRDTRPGSQRRRTGRP